MKETVIVYKKVYASRRNLYSAFVPYYENFCVEYKKGKFVSPKVGELFAFDSLENALKFPQGNQIWKAEATDVHMLRRNVFDTLFNIHLYLDNFWQTETKTKKGSIRPPKGTICCSSIKLLERVWVKNN